MPAELIVLLLACGMAARFEYILSRLYHVDLRPQERTFAPVFMRHRRSGFRERNKINA